MNQAWTGDKQTEEIIDHAQVLDNEARLTGSPEMPPCPVKQVLLTEEGAALVAIVKERLANPDAVRVTLDEL